MKGVLICSSPTVSTGSSLASIVGYSELHAGRTAANGPGEPLLLIRHQEEIRAAGLGQAVDVGEAGLRQEVTHLPTQCAAERLTTSQDSVELDAGDQRLRNRAIERKKFPQHGGYESCVRDVLFGEHFKDGERFKTRLHQHAAAPEQGKQRNPDSKHKSNLQYQHSPGVSRETELTVDCLELANKSTVAQHDALGTVGRSRGENNNGRTS